ncbi:uracil permease [Fodinisporobacter ferrooxydans]|uniref:Uracil permease n=1 Tax=Fodinisporobacter ferrooxydans TaxID=2901836 RepID=A0ABY4CFB1_9BACL|nr:uracil permease [Alicyclobacillaceae bacterium MYW30-H2]
MKQFIDVNERIPLNQGLPLSFQHLFAMFGSTVLVPILVGLDPSIALFAGGLGTLIYILVTKGKIPAYLGSSFAFITPLATVIKTQGIGAALYGALLSGILYVIIALLIAKFGVTWLERLLPPIVVGPIIIVIGLSLAGTAIGMASKSYLVAFVALVIAVLANTYFKGFLAVIPILLGIVGGYLFALTQGIVNLAPIGNARWLQLPHFAAPHISSIAAWTIAPVALVTIAEHIGHLLVTENIVGRNFMKDPGLHRSILGDGIATIVAGAIGGPPTTTYGENIGVMAITRVYSVWVIGGAACIAIAFSFIGKLNALISSIPVPVMGGISILLFGIIAASGLRMLVESKVDFGSKRNLSIASIIMVLGVGNAVFHIHGLEIGNMAIATLVGIVLNLILPDDQKSPSGEKEKLGDKKIA